MMRVCIVSDDQGAFKVGNNYNGDKEIITDINGVSHMIDEDNEVYYEGDYFLFKASDEVKKKIKKMEVMLWIELWEITY